MTPTTRTLLPLLAALLLACSAAPREAAAPAAEVAPSEEAPPSEQTAEAAEEHAAEEAPGAAGEESFGAALSERPVTALADIVADPSRFEGQVVKTEGEVAQVCQRMGCWMEMRAEGTPTIRVPMAGHSFFLPRDAAGRRAVVEGRLALRELSASERAHLESEGAMATAQALQIAADGVVLR